MFLPYYFLPFSAFYPFLRFSFLFSYLLLSLVSTLLVCEIIVHILYSLFIVIVICINFSSFIGILPEEVSIGSRKLALWQLSVTS